MANYSGLDKKLILGKTGEVGYSQNYYYVLHASVWETGQDIAGNYSKVSYKVWIDAPYNTTVTDVTGITGKIKYGAFEMLNNTTLSAGITINGKSVDTVTKANVKLGPSGFSADFPTSVTFLEGSTTVAHNNDGSQSISWTASFTNNYPYNSNSPTNGSIEQSGSLEPIPRASTGKLSATKLTADGSSVTLTISKAVTTFTSTVTWKYGNKTGTTLDKSAAGSATITPNPADLYAQGTSGKLYIYLTTYSGNTQIGDIRTYEVNLTIPDVSTVGGTDANIGSVSTITVNRKSAAYTHSIRYSLGNASGYINDDGQRSTTEVKLNATSIAWTTPTAFYAQIPNAQTGEVTLTIKTYYGDAQVGSAKTSKLTVTASKSNPTITNVYAVDQNAATVALTGDNTKQVRYVSNTKVGFDATPKNSATIKDTSIGGESTGSTTTPTKTYYGYDGSSIALSVTDSRNYSASTNYTPDVIPYIKLTENTRVSRPLPTDGSCRITYAGDYWAGNFGAVSNSLTLEYRYKETEEEQYTNWVTVEADQITISDNKYSAVVGLWNFDYQKYYNIQVRITDALMAYTTDLMLYSGEPVCDWGKNDFNFNVPVSINGVLSAARGVKSYPMAVAGENEVKLIVIPRLPYGTIEPTHDTAKYFKEWLRRVCAAYEGIEHGVFVSVANPNSQGYVIGSIYNTSEIDIVTGLPRYCGFEYRSFGNSNLYCFGTNNYSFTVGSIIVT